VTTATLIGGVDALAPISLDELDATAALRTRVDRKYIVDAGLAAELVGVFAADVRVLDVDGRRSSTFESLYFDTGDFALHRAAAHRRRHRFKVRTRRYPGQPVAVLEVKQKGGRGETTKARLTERADEPGRLDDADRAFVAAAVGRAGVAAELVPTLTTRYDRTTLVLGDAGARVTLDEGLVCTDWAHRRISLDAVIVETKTPGGTSAVDRWLWSRGHRPEAMSKYCTALALLEPSLPSNKWRRTMTRHFG
jgi:hypothetical protein